jgi:hypothetical protein
MGPGKAPHHQSIPQNTKITPSMQEPRNNHPRWKSFSGQNVQILQTRSLQDSLREQHFQACSCEAFVHRRTLPTVAFHTLQLRAACLHFRHVPKALTTCLTAAMCDRIVPITCTGKSSIPFARLSSIFHIRFPILFWFLCCLSLPGTRSCNQKGGGRGTLDLGIQCTRPTDNTLNLHSSFSRLSSIA